MTNKNEEKKMVAQQQHVRVSVRASMTVSVSCRSVVAALSHDLDAMRDSKFK